MAKENQERKPKMVDGFAQPQDVPVLFLPALSSPLPENSLHTF